MGSHPTKFISIKSLIHQALVQNSAVFADYLPAWLTHSFYVPNWRLFRYNLIYEILSPLHIKLYSRAHKWLGDKQIQDIEAVEQKVLFNYALFNSLNFWDRLGKILFKKKKKKNVGRNLQLLEEKWKLTYEEIVSLCSEFLNAATHLTSTTLQWIMENLIKYQHILEDLQKMPYWKVMIWEGLRRCPPRHFVLPHSVTQDTVLDDYLVPKNATINFKVMEISLDPKIWEDPREFRPERFLNSFGGEKREMDAAGNDDSNESSQFYDS
ncbi:hypothetical protein AAG906_004929 [Vitis piasezkii]